MSINLINYALAKKDWKKAYEDLKVLEIGGRNLLMNGDFSKTHKDNPFTVDGKTYDTYPFQWNAYDGAINNPTTNYHAHIDDDTFGFNVVEFNETNGERNRKRIYQSNFEKLLSPTQTGIFTFSVDVYATGTGTRLWGGFYYFRKSDGQRGLHSGQFNIQPTEVNKWVRMSAQCRLNDDVDFSRTIQFYIYGFGFTTNSILYIKNVKLEYGNKVTDWTTAPEDINAHPFVAELAETVFRNKQQDWEKAYEDFKVLGVGGRNLIKDSNNFTNYTKYGGATVTFTTGVSVSEWNATDATRIQTSGGTLQTKLYKDVMTPSVAGQQYTVSVWVKNIGSYPVIVTNNLYSDIGRVNPGEQKRVIITGMGNGITNLQIKFQTTTADISNPLDFIVWRAKVELGNRATDWTPAPEDIDAHPFVAELAETVFRSKQNEERIRNLENAITALGGGS